MVFNLLPHLINGLTLGLLFALIALGFMLIVGVMEQINLAHGSLFALGAYVALVLVGPKPPLPPGIAEWWLAQPLGLRYALTLALAPAVVGLVGIAVELLMRRTYGKDPLFGLLLTFGVAMVIEEAIRLIWGTRDYVLPTPPAISGGFIALDLIWSAYRFYAAAIAALVIGLTWLLIEKTPYGSIIKAGAHDSEMVRALGIDLSKTAPCSCSARCWRRSPASSWRRSGASARTWASMPSFRPSSSSCSAASARSGARSRPGSWSAWSSASPAPMRRNGRCCRCISSSSPS